MKTGNTCPRGAPCATCRMPQWSPAMKTGNTKMAAAQAAMEKSPQWSPAMKTGNTEEGLVIMGKKSVPQWSPAMKTGNTCAARSLCGCAPASMEPGHEDREYQTVRGAPSLDPNASMEPGHEDREYRGRGRNRLRFLQGLNGARP